MQSFISILLTVLQLYGCRNSWSKRRIEIDVGRHNLQLQRLLGSHLQSFHFTTPERHDNEFVETFAVVYDGEVTVDGVEVSKFEFVPVSRVLFDIQQEPEHYTAWFVREVGLLGDKIHFVPSGAAAAASESTATS